MEVSALKHSGGIGLHARSPLLRLQSDERLVALVRRGNSTAFEVLVSRYESRLLSFCRHLLGSREDAEDVLQEVMAAAFNAMIADDRPINVRPWLYRIARNRSLNHLRRIRAIGVDSMDIHLSEHGLSTADKVHEREEFRLLVGDIHELPETQKTALVLREMDALSYEQIAEAMETTVPERQVPARPRPRLSGRGGRGAPAVLRGGADRARRGGRGPAPAQQPAGPPSPEGLQALLGLPHPAQADQQGADGDPADRPDGHPQEAGHHPPRPFRGLGRHRRPAPARPGRPPPPGGGLLAGSSAGGFVSAGMGAIATKAAAGLAAAALVTGAAVEVEHSSQAHPVKHPTASLSAPALPAPAPHVSPAWATPVHVLDKPLKNAIGRCCDTPTRPRRPPHPRSP